MVTETTADVWREKKDDELRSAAGHLANYTAETEQVIRAELRRRALPEPPPTIRTEARARTSLAAGRMGRLRFFLWLLGANLLALILSAVITVSPAVLLASIFLAHAAVKRLHDLGRSGGYVIFLFIPLVNLVLLLVLLLKKGQDHINQYG